MRKKKFFNDEKFWSIISIIGNKNFFHRKKLSTTSLFVTKYRDDNLVTNNYYRWKYHISDEFFTSLISYSVVVLSFKIGIFMSSTFTLLMKSVLWLVQIYSTFDWGQPFDEIRYDYLYLNLVFTLSLGLTFIMTFFIFVLTHMFKNLLSWKKRIEW